MTLNDVGDLVNTDSGNDFCFTTPSLYLNQRWLIVNKAVALEILMKAFAVSHFKITINPHNPADNELNRHRYNALVWLIVVTDNTLVHIYYIDILAYGVWSHFCTGQKGNLINTFINTARIIFHQRLLLLLTTMRQSRVTLIMLDVYSTYIHI